MMTLDWEILLQRMSDKIIRTEYPRHPWVTSESDSHEIVNLTFSPTRPDIHIGKRWSRWIIALGHHGLIAKLEVMLV